MAKGAQRFGERRFEFGAPVFVHVLRQRRNNLLRKQRQRKVLRAVLQRHWHHLRSPPGPQGLLDGLKASEPCSLPACRQPLRREPVSTARRKCPPRILDRRLRDGILRFLFASKCDDTTMRPGGESFMYRLYTIVDLKATIAYNLYCEAGARHFLGGGS